MTDQTAERLECPGCEFSQSWGGLDDWMCEVTCMEGGSDGPRCKTPEEADKRWHRIVLLPKQAKTE